MPHDPQILRRLHPPAVVIILLGIFAVMMAFLFLSMFFQAITILLGGLFLIALGFGLLRGYELARKFAVALLYLSLLFLFRLLLLLLFGIEAIKPMLDVVMKEMLAESSGNLSPSLTNNADAIGMFGTSVLRYSIVMISLPVLGLVLILRRCRRPDITAATYGLPGVVANNLQQLSDVAIFLLFYGLSQGLTFFGLLVQNSALIEIFGEQLNFNSLLWRFGGLLAAIASCYFLWKARKIALFYQAISSIFSIFLWLNWRSSSLSTSASSNTALFYSQSFLNYRILEESMLLAMLLLIFYYVNRTGLRSGSNMVNDESGVSDG